MILVVGMLIHKHTYMYPCPCYRIAGNLRRIFAIFIDRSAAAKIRATKVSACACYNANF